MHPPSDPGHRVVLCHEPRQTLYQQNSDILQTVNTRSGGQRPEEVGHDEVRPLQQIHQVRRPAGAHVPRPHLLHHRDSLHGNGNRSHEQPTRIWSPQQHRRLTKI